MTKDEIRAKWVAALRSGDYTQGHNRLVCPVGEDSYSYCCLGVLTDVLGIDPDNIIIGAEYIGSVYNRLVISKDCQHMLSSLNDSHHWDFHQIADLIEGLPEAVEHVLALDGLRGSGGGLTLHAALPVEIFPDEVVKAREELGTNGTQHGG